MKRRDALLTLLLVVGTIFFAGCVTHRIDWAGRVGTYTYDQAVTELGPPDKQATLSDGRLVAEWISRYYNSGTAIVGAGYYGYPGGVGVCRPPPPITKANCASPSPPTAS
jgi:hypothetical protein